MIHLALKHPQILSRLATFPRPLNVSLERTKWPTGLALTRCLVSTSLFLMSVLGYVWLIYWRVCWQDTVETFFDARIDLIQRTLTKHSDRLKIRAEEAMNKMKTPAGEDLAENLDREMQKFKIKVCMSVILQPRLVLNRDRRVCGLRLVGAATVNQAFINLAFYEGRPD